MLQLKLYPVDRQFQETRSIFLRNIFPRLYVFQGTISENLITGNNIPRKSLKAVYKRTVISNNAPCNGLLHSKNISSKFVTASSDPRITDLRCGTC